MKYLIINADDFGWSRDTVDSIIDLHQKGVISSTTVMATMPAFNYGLAKLKENPALGAGVHLSIFDGRPVLPPAEVTSLVDEDSGLFLSYSEATKRGRRFRTREVAAEYEAQIERFLESGLKPTHLDVHTMLPYFKSSWYNSIIKLALKYKLPLRTVLGKDFKEKRSNIARRIKIPAVLLLILGRRLISKMDRNGIVHPDYFISEFSDNDNEADVEEKVHQLISLIRGLRSGVSEILTHPSSSGELWRRIENTVWNDPRIDRELQKGEIKLISYKALSKIGRKH
ncbi:MAG: ChbG/HpnK family deacetylase [Spirochaetales bacterium]|nr:ChbG/HpnK family deacetylase [Spirochaetales bacterium]